MPVLYSKAPLWESSGSYWCSGRITHTSSSLDAQALPSSPIDRYCRGGTIFLLVLYSKAPLWESSGSYWCSGRITHTASTLNGPGDTATYKCEGEGCLVSPGHRQMVLLNRPRTVLGRQGRQAGAQTGSGQIAVQCEFWWKMRPCQRAQRVCPQLV